ncbi:Floricaula/leafy homolog [Linum perenne]
MDPEAFTASLFKWDPRTAAGGASNNNNNNNNNNRPLMDVAPPPIQQQMAAALAMRASPARDMCGLEGLFQTYGIRYYTVVKIAELGFTVSTLLEMKEDELDEMLTNLSHIFRWELFVGERFGVKAAVRAERRRLDDLEESRRRHLHSGDTATNALDALSQEGLSEERMQLQEKEAGGSGGGGKWEVVGGGQRKLKQQQQQQQQRRRKWQRNINNNKEEHHHHQHQHQVVVGMDEEEEDEDEDSNNNNNIVSSERQREHPFIVTEPGEVARGKKNGLDYLFHLYEQCRDFLFQVQSIAKERGEKCPTKVTNQVFRYAKKAGASYINKPKMRHYVHCYALHCLDEDASNGMRRAFKESGENVGAWRQACYKPLVSIAATQGWDIDAIFNAHPRLSIWYVPTKLRQLCHAERNSASAAAASTSITAPPNHLPF